jgi:hypothetical protein
MEMAREMELKDDSKIRRQKNIDRQVPRPNTYAIFPSRFNIYRNVKYPWAPVCILGLDIRFLILSVYSISQSIKLFIEGQAFSRSQDLAPRPPPAPH